MKTIDYILDFCKELGKEMIASGANIERVNMTQERICHAYGLHDVTVANLTTRISVSAKDDQKDYAQRQTDVPPQVINLGKPLISQHRPQFLMMSCLVNIKF